MRYRYSIQKKNFHLLIYFRRGQGAVPTPRKPRGSLPMEELNSGGGDELGDDVE